MPAPGQVFVTGERESGTDADLAIVTGSTGPPRQMEVVVERGDVVRVALDRTAVRIYGGDGREIARGLAQYGARDLRLIKGLRSTQIAETLGYDYGPEVVHRDDMVLL